MSQGSLQTVCESKPPCPCVGSSGLFWAAAAAFLIPTGLIWDVSWESSIGVDRFWSPPHLATHLGVWLAGALATWLLVAFTCGGDRLSRAAGVGIGLLRAPVGAWLLLWSVGVIETAFLIDSWWQRAYGLGAGLWPPPQILKAVGFFGVLLGSLALCASAAASRPRLAALLSQWQGGLLLSLCALMLMMNNYPNLQHTGSFYLVSCAVYPVLSQAAGGASQTDWGATKAALCYMAIGCAMLWVIPLFPAHPLTPPINNPTDHLVPPPFPLLLLLPAAVMDGLCRRLGRKGSKLLLATILGAGFLAAFLPAQWFFAEFLLSPASANRFFAGGGQHWPFFLKIDKARVMFWGTREDPLTGSRLFLALAFAAFSAWVGLHVGERLRNLSR
jgi:hypothetical protein